MGNTCCEVTASSQIHNSQTSHKNPTQTVQDPPFLNEILDDDTITNIKNFTKTNSSVKPDFLQRRKNKFGSIVLEKSPHNQDSQRK